MGNESICRGEIIAIFSASFILASILMFVMGILRRDEYMKFLLLAIMFIGLANLLFVYYLGYISKK